MPSFNCDAFIKVYDVHRATLDVGYNVYHTRLRLGTNTVLPITTAHQTSDPHLWSGSRARTTAAVAVHDRSLLFTANDVTLVGFNPIPESTDKPVDYLDLPRFMLDGYVVNPYIVDRDIPGAFAFDVRIERPDMAPYNITDVRCWVNRERHRFDDADIKGLADRALVTVAGRFCGWSYLNNVVMLDVHDMCFSPDGEVPENTLGPSQRFWERANWADGLANFHGVRGPPPPTTGYTISVLAKPSLRAPDTQPRGMPMPQGWTPPYSGPTRHVQVANAPSGERAHPGSAARTNDPGVEDAPAAARAPHTESAARSNDPEVEDSPAAARAPTSSDNDADAALAVPRPRAPTPRGAPEVHSAAEVDPGHFFIRVPPLANRAIHATRRDEARAASGEGTSLGAAAMTHDDSDTLSPSPPSSVVAEPPTPARAADAASSGDVNMDDDVGTPTVDAHDDVDMDDADEYFPYRAGKRKRPVRGSRGMAAKVDPAIRTIG